MKPTYLYITIAILFLSVLGLGYKIYTFQPVVVDDGKYKYLEKQHEDLKKDFFEATRQVTELQKKADEKPKEIIKIKIKYVQITDSIIALPIIGKEQLLASRLHN